MRIKPMTPRIIMTENPKAYMMQNILNLIVRFNEDQTGINKYKCPIAILLSHPDTGDIIGGLWGETMFSYLHVDLLFVPETLRYSGIGRQLMTQAEEEATRRGCHGAWLDTFSFQARRFYERLGYAVFGTIEDYPPGHSRFFMKKTLGTRTGAEK
jgi:GNAT superfamily N-acetyltransferase